MYCAHNAKYCFPVVASRRQYILVVHPSVTNCVIILYFRTELIIYLTVIKEGIVELDTHKTLIWHTWRICSKKQKLGLGGGGNL